MATTIAATGAPPAPPQAAIAATNMIRDWNAIALEANRQGHTDGTDPLTLGPTGSARALAIVHLAMHDAYFSIAGGYDPYMPGLPANAPGASADAAAHAAAKATLRALYPSRPGLFNVTDPTGPGAPEGLEHGEAVAQAILADRQDDPPPSDVGYTPRNGRGMHRPDPANPGHGFYGPFVGATRMFALQTRYQLDAHPDLRGPEYRRALDEVAGKGILPELAGTVPDALEPRTALETTIGMFWAYDGPPEIGTPPRLYNQIVAQVSRERGNSTAADARLFALVNSAMADAGFLAWAEKYRYNLWRPVVGVREHDAASDPMWLPLGAVRTNPPLPSDAKAARSYPPRAFTPPFPAYPSGHATFGAAALQSVRLFYDRNIADGPDTMFPGSFVSAELDGKAVDERGYLRPRSERHFPGGLWQMIEENGRSRVYLGVHWVFDAFAVDATGAMDLDQFVGGVPLGLRVARDLAAPDGLRRSEA